MHLILISSIPKKKETAHHTLMVLKPYLSNKMPHKHITLNGH